MNGLPALPLPRLIWRVAQLNLQVRQCLEGHFPDWVWVEGEVSNLSKPASGHCYFTLKDSQAQVRCALFRNRSAVRVPISNGQQVVVGGSVTLFESRGEYQIIVEAVEAAGEGALRRNFEALRQSLGREGLFDVSRKRRLPALPLRVGVITSGTGAALRDVLSVLKRRCRLLPVVIYPTLVQGEQAGPRIAAALHTAGRRRDCDVLLLVRGGGSLEDLWAFNEEIVVRAVANCPIPLVSGVGHETDVTLTDFAADVRAPTPSAAAELVSPNLKDWAVRRDKLAQRLLSVIQRQLSDYRRLSAMWTQRLQRQQPLRRLREQCQRLDGLALRLQRPLPQQLRQLRQRLQQLTRRLGSDSLAQRNYRSLVHRLEQRLRRRGPDLIRDQRQQLALLTHRLQTISPLNTLARGYAIVQKLPEGDILRRADQVAVGALVRVRLSEGELHCRVGLKL